MCDENMFGIKQETKLQKLLFYVYIKLNQQIFGKMQPKETDDKL